MSSLKKYLEENGYDCVCPNLPLTYKEIEYAVSLLENKFEDVLPSLKEDEKICFVGHSTGGLVIKKFLQNTNHLSKIGRCVLIATPNHGSKLADISSKLKPYYSLFKTLKSISSVHLEKNPIPHTEGIEIGAIAGSKNDLLLGRLLKEENDGRVEVHSVFYPELTDFLILPYGHKTIHYQKDTLECVIRFFETGKFINH